MTKIFKQLARHWAVCLVVFALLFVQAYCDLALPDYTSKIVDTGIQQGGIESPLPQTVRQSTLDALSLLMSEEDAQKLQNAYQYYLQDDGVLQLRSDLTEDERTALEDAVTTPDIVLYMAAAQAANTPAGQNSMGMTGLAETPSAAADADTETVTPTAANLDTVCSQFAAMSQMPGFDRSMLQKQLDGAMSQLDSTLLENLKSQSLLLVQLEYEAQGVAQDVQMGYLFRVGGQMLALTLLIPELVQSFHSLYLQIESNIPRWTAYLSAQDTNMDWLMHWLEGIDWEQLLHRITNSIDTVLVNAVGAVSATVNLVVTASFALIISIYMSLGAESLCHHARTLVCAYLKPSHAAGLLKFCRLFRQSFANFLTGQCSEAVILGVLMTLAFSVFRIPYGSLVGMLTAICAIIPYVGALISCVVSVFLVLLVDPVLAVRCLIVYLAVQFIENQFIYPRVVGKSVGLSPFYTLVAAMIGGKLFGIIGIIFFIPLTAVVIELVKEDAFRRLHTKETLS